MLLLQGGVAARWRSVLSTAADPSMKLPVNAFSWEGVMAASALQRAAPHLHLVLTLVVVQLDDLDGVAKDEAAGGKLSHLVSG